MGKRFKNQKEIDNFLETPRLAMLLYNGGRASPTGVPVWFDWDGKVVRMFAGKRSPKIRCLRNNPNVSILITNNVGEVEGWVAFEGKVSVGSFDANEWVALIDRMGSRYWDLSDDNYANVINQWRSAPGAMASLELTPETIRSGS